MWLNVDPSLLSATTDVKDHRCHFLHRERGDHEQLQDHPRTINLHIYPFSIPNLIFAVPARLEQGDNGH
jgi:hypothetical protein